MALTTRCARSVVGGFSPEFLTGMTEESRARRLGDVGSNAPEMGVGLRGPRAASGGDVLCRARRLAVIHPKSARARLERSVRRDSLAEDCRSRWRRAFRVCRRHQPAADRLGAAPDTTRPQLDYSNIVALGEFLLGYPNEYNKYTERPLLEPDAASAALLAAEDVPDKKDLGRNGTYLVMRQLRSGRAGLLAISPPASGRQCGRGRETWRRPSSDAPGGRSAWCRRSTSHSRDRSGPGGDSPESIHLRGGQEGRALSFWRAHLPRESAQHRFSRATHG